MALVELAQREQRLDALGSGFADADQDPRGERHRRLTGCFHALETARRRLVGRAEMRTAALRESLGHAFEHQPLRGAHSPQCAQVVPAQQAWIHVRQETGPLEHEPGAARQVLERRLAAERTELFSRGSVAKLRLVPEREERLVATGRRPGPRNGEHLLLGHVRPFAAPRRPGERAVVADVPAELRQRDEHLRRVGDERPVALGAHSARLHAELSERRVEQLGSSGH